MLAPTAFARAAILPVSAASGDGIPQLIDHLTRLLDAIPPRMDFGTPRLPIDRAFTMSGFGTVVTGTLLGGSLRVGDDIELQPSGLRGRVRGLQSYRQAVETAHPGSRVAVNIAGVERQAVERGDVLTTPGALQPTMLLDVQFRYLDDANRPLRHNTAVKFFSGAAEAGAHARLIADESLAPGRESWLQLRLDRPLALARGDRFILRIPSPAQTIGGGVVVDPHPARRWKRMQPNVIAALERRLHGTPAERIAQAAVQPVKRGDLAALVEDIDAAITDALDSGLLVALPDGFYLSTESAQILIRRMTRDLAAFHEAQPMRVGMPREELRSRAGLKTVTFAALLDMQDQIVADGNWLRIADHVVRFDAAQTARIAQLQAKIAESPYTPPSFAEAAQIVGADVLYALIDTGEIVQVQPDVIFSRAVYAEMVDAVFGLIDAQGGIAAAALRDRFGTSRKYAIALLEHLDSLGKTRREGDTRVRGRS
ncbi:MAG: SelB C-terminal domain-containing protein [Anaerolineae bacterium]|nr:SelB C-terminal domain-containing protein [Anaerolineae bacterium]